MSFEFGSTFDEVVDTPEALDDNYFGVFGATEPMISVGSNLQLDFPLDGLACNRKREGNTPEWGTSEVAVLGESQGSAFFIRRKRDGYYEYIPMRIAHPQGEIPVQAQGLRFKTETSSESYQRSVELTLALKAYKLADQFTHGTQGELIGTPGTLQERFHWNEANINNRRNRARIGGRDDSETLSLRETFYRDRGMQLLSNLAEVITPDILPQGYEYGRPYSRIFDALTYAIYVLQENNVRLNIPPDVADFQFALDDHSSVVPDRDQITELDITPCIMAVYTMRSELNDLVASISERLANKTQGQDITNLLPPEVRARRSLAQAVAEYTGTYAPSELNMTNHLYFPGMDRRIASDLIGRIVGAGYMETGKAAVYGISERDMLHQQQLREQTDEQARPITIFDICHEEQRGMTVDFMNNLNADDRGRSYREHAEELQRKFQEFRSRGNLNEVIESLNSREEMVDFRDSIMMHAYNLLYKHLDVYQGCEYIDVLNPAARRTIEEYSHTHHLDPSIMLHDIVSIQHNLFSVISSSDERVIPLVRHDLDPGGRLSVTDFARGNCEYMYGNVDFFGGRTAEGIINTLNTLQEMIDDCD